MKRIKVIYVSYDELYQAYLDCRKRKRGTANEISFEIDENVKLYNLWVDLNTGAYVVGRSICFINRRPVPREVFAADFVDRIVHHLFINRVIKFIEKYEFIEDSYSCRVGKGTLYGVLRCKEFIKECSENYTKDCYILKCDLKSFFVTIDKDILYEKFYKFLTERCGYSGRDLRFMEWLLKLIIYDDPAKKCIIRGKRSDWLILPKEKSLFYCMKNKGLPIGNLTSQIFANFFLSVFDHYVIEELGFKYYGRYVDDFFIIDKSKEKLLNSIEKIRSKLSEIGVILHPKKLYLQHYTKGIKFIGHIIKFDRIYVGNRTKGNFYQIIMNKTKLFEKDVITYKELLDFVSSINSYLGFMVHCNSFKIRKKMLSHDKMIKFYKFGCTNGKHSLLMIKHRRDEYKFKKKGE